MNLKDLAVAHPYYASDSNYYSTSARVVWHTMSDFLDEFEGDDVDVDLNLVYRWDVRERYDDDDNPLGMYKAEVFIIKQRKGIYMPNIIDHVYEADVSRFIEYLQPHQETLRAMWEPLT